MNHDSRNNFYELNIILTIIRKQDNDFKRYGLHHLCVTLPQIDSSEDEDEDDKKKLPTGLPIASLVKPTLTIIKNIAKKTPMLVKQLPRILKRLKLTRVINYMGKGLGNLNKLRGKLITLKNAKSIFNTANFDRGIKAADKALGIGNLILKIKDSIGKGKNTIDDDSQGNLATEEEESTSLNNQLEFEKQLNEKLTEKLKKLQVDKDGDTPSKLNISSGILRPSTLHRRTSSVSTDLNEFSKKIDNESLKVTSAESMTIDPKLGLQLLKLLNEFMFGLLFESIKDSYKTSEVYLALYLECEYKYNGSDKSVLKHSMKCFHNIIPSCVIHHLNTTEILLLLDAITKHTPKFKEINGSLKHILPQLSYSKALDLKGQEESRVEFYKMFIDNDLDLRRLARAHSHKSLFVNPKSNRIDLDKLNKYFS